MVLCLAPEEEKQNFNIATVNGSLSTTLNIQILVKLHWLTSKTTQTK
jgi:hypothetical protein